MSLKILEAINSNKYCRIWHSLTALAGALVEPPNKSRYILLQASYPLSTKQEKYKSQRDANNFYITNVKHQFGKTLEKCLTLIYFLSYQDMNAETINIHLRNIFTCGILYRNIL